MSNSERGSGGASNGGSGRTDTYFAQMAGNDLSDECWRRIQKYRDFLASTGRLILWQTAYEMFYREYGMLGTNDYTGDHAQYSNTHINHFKSLLTRLPSIIAPQRIQWTAMATNADTASLVQATLGQDVLAYYLKTKAVDAHVAEQLMWGYISGEGFIKQVWDIQSGDIVGVHEEPDGSKVPLHEGDVKHVVLDPTCIIRDPTAKSWIECDWFISVEKRNRFDEAAKTRDPELAKEILKLTADSTEEALWHFVPTWWTENPDMIPVYSFFHRRTPACPAGRYAKFYNADTLAFAVGLPYDELPIHRFAPEEHLGGPFGWTPAFNMLTIQESYDLVGNQILTNHELFGVQHVAMFEGSGVNYETLPNGATAIQARPVAGAESDSFPRGLNLLQVAPDSYKFRDALSTDLETISGVNSVARGTPPQGVTAGTALALLQSMALQTNSPAQQNYVSMLERLGTGLIDILKRFAKTKRMVEIVGKNNRSYLKDFVGDDLAGIRRVTVDIGNPLTDTLPGKLSVADNLLKSNMLTTPQEYFQVLKTGTLDPLLHGQQAELMLINRENELLSEGQSVEAIKEDDHALHISEHKSVLADPDIRKNAVIMSAVRAHLTEHEGFMNPPQVGGPPPGSPQLGQPPGQQPPSGAPPQQPPGQPPPGGQQPPHPKHGAHTPKPRAPGNSIVASLLSPAAAQAQATLMGQPNLPTSPLAPKIKK